MALALGVQLGYGVTDVLPVDVIVTVAVTDGEADPEALALALALAVSLCAYTEERHKSARIWNILLLFKKRSSLFLYQFYGGIRSRRSWRVRAIPAHDLYANF